MKIKLRKSSRKFFILNQEELYDKNFFESICEVYLVGIDWIFLELKSYVESWTMDYKQNFTEGHITVSFLII